MIEIDIKMNVHGQGKVYGLVCIAIVNVGGDENIGEYQYFISHQFNSVYATGAIKRTGVAEPTPLYMAENPNSPWIWKKGRIKGFPRSKGAAALLLAVLRGFA